MIYFSNEEDGSTSADNEKNSKDSEKKDVTVTKEDLDQESTSFLQSRLSLLTKISMKQNAQNWKNVESWNFLDLNLDYSADLLNENFKWKKSLRACRDDVTFCRDEKFSNFFFQISYYFLEETDCICRCNNIVHLKVLSTHDNFFQHFYSISTSRD